MKLYGSLTSPYARKVRILIAEKALPCEFVAIDPGASAGPLGRLNPLGKVPVLERDDGSTLFDSPVILEYLDSLAAPALIPAAGEAHWTVRRWEALADGIMDAVVARLIETRRPPTQQSEDVIRKQEVKVANALDFAEAQLDDAPYLAGRSFTVADIAFGAAVEYIDLRYPHDWRQTHARLARWHAGVAERASFRATRPPA